jgi:bacteriorhodopsin
MKRQLSKLSVALHKGPLQSRLLVAIMLCVSTFCIATYACETCKHHPEKYGYYTCPEVGYCDSVYDSLSCYYYTPSEAITCTRSGYPPIDVYFEPCGTSCPC